MAALTGQEWCHQCFSDGHGPPIMVPLRRCCLFEEEGRIVTSLLFFFPSLSPLKYSLGKTEKGNETLSGLPPAGGWRWCGTSSPTKSGGGAEAVGPCWAQLPGVYWTVCFHHFSLRREMDHTAVLEICKGDCSQHPSLCCHPSIQLAMEDVWLCIAPAQ